jgi:DNA polymerase-3 subunit delta
VAFAAKSDTTLASLSAGWAKGVFHPVYFFAGPDTLQKDEAVKILQKAFLKGDESGLNVDKFDGETSSAAEIVNAYQTLPFLGGGRLILVRRAHALSPAEAGLVAEILEKPPAGNCLVLLWDEKSDARSALVRAARTAGKELMFWVPFEDQLPRWVMDRARAAGREMKPDAARALLEAVGPSLPDLAAEVEKLALYVKEGAAIEEADVEAMGGGNRTLRFMEWDRALWARDRREVLHLYQVMKSQGQPPEALLSQAGRALQKLLLGKALKAEKVPPMDMWDRLWIKTREPRQAFEEAINARDWDSLLDDVESLAQAERDLKTGRMDPETGMTLLLCRLTRP